MLKVIGGEAKGKFIKVKGKVRPTLSRVKQAIFDILADKVKQANVLDLYAGSGALGIESLSRGAKRVTFIDKGNIQVKTIKDNLKSLLPNKDKEAATVLKFDVFEGLRHLHRKGEVFDIIFLAPPFLKNYVRPTLNCLYQLGLLKEDGIIIVEHHKKESVPINISSLEGKDLHLYKQRKFGDTVITFYKLLFLQESKTN